MVNEGKNTDKRKHLKEFMVINDETPESVSDDVIFSLGI